MLHACDAHLIRLTLHFLSVIRSDKMIPMKYTCASVNAGKKQKNPTYNDGDLGNLPEPVQRFFRYALTPGQPVVTQCKLKQTGEFRSVTAAQS